MKRKFEKIEEASLHIDNQAELLCIGFLFSYKLKRKNGDNTAFANAKTKCGQIISYKLKQNTSLRTEMTNLRLPQHFPSRTCEMRPA